MKHKEYYYLAIFIIVFFITVGIFSIYIKSYASVFIDNFGLVGLFLIVMALDTFIQPIPPDFFVFGYVLGGEPLYVAALVGGCASFIAGSLGYGLGGLIGEQGFQRWFKKKHLDNGRKWFNKYGVISVILGALSPLPYNVICWAAGIYKMRYSHFVLSALFRFPRYLLVGLVGIAF